MALSFVEYGAGSYRAVIHLFDPTSARRVKWVELPAVERITVDRADSTVSQCTLEVRYPDDPGMQRLVADLHVIRFEVDVWRDDLPIWSGPITELRYRRAGFKLVAKDFLWWLSRRFLHERVAFVDELGEDGTADLAVIARAAVEAALSVGGDLDLLRWLDVREGGRVGTGRYELVDRPTCLEVLDDLRPLGLTYTAFGRRLLLVSGGEAAPTFGTFTELDFTGELEVVENADEACTVAAVPGGGQVGVAGAADPYWGLVERRFDLRSEQTRLPVLTQAAAQQLAARNPPPVTVVLPSNAALSPICQVHPQLLFPGSVGTVAVTGGVRPVVQAMRIDTVTFARSGGQPEEVSVELKPVGVLAGDV